MAGITLQTHLNAASNERGWLQNSSRPTQVLVIGDFSGRQSRGECDSHGLAQRKLHRIDKDSFEQVFATLNVALKLAVAEQPLRFEELDQLHPDYLYQNLDLFARYRQLLRQLRSHAHYQSAVQALTEEGIASPAKTAEQDELADTDTPASASLLDDMISAGSTQPAAFDIAALIRQTVAPYIEPARDPKAGEYIAAVERAIGDMMRKLLQEPHFKALEASWRSLDWLNRRADTDREVHVHLLDASKQELANDWQNADADMQRTQLGRRLIEGAGVPGEAKIDYLLLDTPITDADSDAQIVEYFAQLAGAVGADVLVGADAAQLGLEQAAEVAVETDVSQSPLQTEQWRELRQRPLAHNVYLAAPGFLVRLPFGERSNRIGSLQFEEAITPSALATYVWGNSAYLLVLSQLRRPQGAEQAGQSDGTSARLGNMPIYVFRDAEGDECVVPAAGVFLSSKYVTQLEQLGITPVQSVKNSDEILLQRVLPLAGD